jgi:hypothetical protein
MSTSGQNIFKKRWIIYSTSQLQSSNQKTHRDDGDPLSGSWRGSLRNVLLACDSLF